MLALFCGVLLLILLLSLMIVALCHIDWKKYDKPLAHAVASPPQQKSDSSMVRQRSRSKSNARKKKMSTTPTVSPSSSSEDDDSKALREREKFERMCAAEERSMLEQAKKVKEIKAKLKKQKNMNSSNSRQGKEKLPSQQQQSVQPVRAVTFRVQVPCHQVALVYVNTNFTKTSPSPLLRQSETDFEGTLTIPPTKLGTTLHYQYVIWNGTHWDYGQVYEICVTSNPMIVRDRLSTDEQDIIYNMEEAERYLSALIS